MLSLERFGHEVFDEESARLFLGIPEDGRRRVVPEDDLARRSVADDNGVSGAVEECAETELRSVDHRAPDGRPLALFHHDQSIVLLGGPSVDTGGGKSRSL